MRGVEGERVGEKGVREGGKKEGCKEGGKRRVESAPLCGVLEADSPDVLQLDLSQRGIPKV